MRRGSLGRVTSARSRAGRPDRPRSSSVRRPGREPSWSGSGPSSSSGSTRASTCCRSSCAARPCRAAPRRPPPWSGSARGSSTPSLRTPPAVKPQVAFFEALGRDGWRALETVCRYAREAGLLVIADAKRGDIGSTARAYAAAFLEPRGADPPLADALTVNPYLGADSRRAVPRGLPPPRRRHLLLVRTSNAGARDSRTRRSPTGTPVWRHVAGLVREWGEDLVGERGMSSVGAVVGATVPAGDRRRPAGDAAGDHPAARRRRAGRRRPADVARAFTSGPASALVNASRSVIYAYRDRRATTGGPPPGPRPPGSRPRSGPRRAGERSRGRWSPASLRRSLSCSRRRSSCSSCAPGSTSRRHPRRWRGPWRRPATYVIRGGDTLERSPGATAPP